MTNDSVYQFMSTNIKKKISQMKTFLNNRCVLQWKRFLRGGATKHWSNVQLLPTMASNKNLQSWRIKYLTCHDSISWRINIQHYASSIPIHGYIWQLQFKITKPMLGNHCHICRTFILIINIMAFQICQISNNTRQLNMT